MLVMVPARSAVQVIRNAAAAGARSATIITSGFSELQDDESQRLAAELQAAIRETGLAVTGPNCLGNLSASEKIFTNIDDRIVTWKQDPSRPRRIDRRSRPTPSCQKRRRALMCEQV